MRLGAAPALMHDNAVVANDYLSYLQNFLITYADIAQVNCAVPTAATGIVEARN